MQIMKMRYKNKFLNIIVKDSIDIFGSFVKKLKKANFPEVKASFK